MFGANHDIVDAGEKVPKRTDSSPVSWSRTNTAEIYSRLLNRKKVLFLQNNTRMHSRPLRKAKLNHFHNKLLLYLFYFSSTSIIVSPGIFNYESYDSLSPKTRCLWNWCEKQDVQGMITYFVINLPVILSDGCFPKIFEKFDVEKPRLEAFLVKKLYIKLSSNHLDNLLFYFVDANYIA